MHMCRLIAQECMLVTRKYALHGDKKSTRTPCSQSLDHIAYLFLRINFALDAKHFATCNLEAHSLDPAVDTWRIFCPNHRLLLFSIRILVLRTKPDTEQRHAVADKLLDGALNM